MCSEAIVPDVSDEFDVAVSLGSSTPTIAVTGELDLATCPRLAGSLDTVVDAGTGDVLVDLSRVTFLDSTALTVLVTYRQRLASAGRHLVVHQPSPVVVRVLTISGLLDAFVGQAFDAD